MAKCYKNIKAKVHRLIPSRYPTVQIFDWAESAAEAEELALLEGMTNDRILCELGYLHLVSVEDWVSGPGASPLMAAFTHVSVNTRFSDGRYGVYYAADTLKTALAETCYHRERFLSASSEPACEIQMRQYKTNVVKPLVDLSGQAYKKYLQQNIDLYPLSQKFASTQRDQNEWGLWYPSVRSNEGKCAAIFRPNALAIPVQGDHFSYHWDGYRVVTVQKIIPL